MKVLLADNPQHYAQVLASLQDKIAPVQKALDDYTALGIATVPTVSELAEMQEEPHSFLLKMLTNRQPITLTGGIPVSPEKAWDLMQKPAGAEEFAASIAGRFRPTETYYQLNRLNLDACELVNGRLQVKQSLKDQFKEESRVYATTQAQVDEWAQIKAIATALDAIRKMTHLGRTFDAVSYLQKALVATENLDDNRPAAGNPQFVVSPR